MLESIELKNFTAFKEAKFEFASRLNVFVGENGSGKTHLLKLGYCTIKYVTETALGGTAMHRELGWIGFSEKILSVFRPDELGHLVHHYRHRQRCRIACSFPGQRRRLAFEFESDANLLRVEEEPETQINGQAVYLPTRELLTIFPGFLSLYETAHIPFDETWRDCCVLLGKPLLRDVKKGNTVTKLLEPLDEAMGGKLEFDASGRFYLNVGEAKMEIHLVAEGFRKLAMLARLIANGSLSKGSCLFWDEPEANLNPKIIKLVARVILRLCKAGIQVFIGSHSLFLLRELDILLQSTEFKGVKAQFIGLHRGEQSVDSQQGDSIDDIGEIDALQEELSQSDRYLDAGAR